MATTLQNRTTQGDFTLPTLDGAILEVIRRIASKQGKTTKDLADALGTSERHALLIMRGHARLNFWVIDRISSYLEIQWQVTGYFSETD